MLFRDQTLERYRKAAEKIKTSATRREDTANKEYNGGKATEDETTDADEIATQQLLSRQAGCLLKYDEFISNEQKCSLRVDESLIRTRLEDLATISMSKFYSYRHDLLPYAWRQIYTDTLILTTYLHILQSVSRTGRLSDETLDIVVENLDRALITAGGAGELGAPWIEQTLKMLENLWSVELPEERPLKRQKTSLGRGVDFSSAEPHGRPTTLPDRECARYDDWTLQRFEDYMNMDNGDPSPAVFTGLMQDWPALMDHPWRSPDYLMSKTFGGRRLVPVEVGRSYVDEGWGQELIQFKDFLKKYIHPATSQDSPGGDNPAPTGYLAQHNLFNQIPSLRNDIQVPDFCWADVPPHPSDPSKNQPAVDAPQLNAWFGPARTITPLHTDGYHNLLCQVVGAKYVRLYPPSATAALRPRPPEGGVDMSNTSAVDVGVLEGWDPVPSGADEGGMDKLRDDLGNVPYLECVITPGDALLIPIGWWHYVRSLSVSFSVSFWWN